jgi:hypothetical protein
MAEPASFGLSIALMSPGDTGGEDTVRWQGNGKGKQWDKRISMSSTCYCTEGRFTVNYQPVDFDNQSFIIQL